VTIGRGDRFDLTAVVANVLARLAAILPGRTAAKTVPSDLLQRA